jgi:hypothetical protein
MDSLAGANLIRVDQSHVAAATALQDKVGSSNVCYLSKQRVIEGRNYTMLKELDQFRENLTNGQREGGYRYSLPCSSIIRIEKHSMKYDILPFFLRSLYFLCLKGKSSLMDRWTQ